MTSVAERAMFRPARAALGLLFVLLLAACSPSEQSVIRLSGATMGTIWHATVVDRERRLDAVELQQQIDDFLVAINQSMSTYIEDSELNRLNRTPVGEWFEASEALFEVLLLATEVSWLSGGAFDVTVGPLVRLWGFGPDPARDQVPDADAIEQARQAVGFSRLEFDLLDNRVRRKAPVEIDLSGIAKGYGADLLCALLSVQGALDYMVEIGGDICLAGNSPRGGPWRIAIETPDSAGQRAHRVVEVSGLGMVTSGDYRNYFEDDGRRFSHTIDPATGYPVEHGLASVTVIAENAAYADALATAIMVMGPESGLRLAEQQGLAVYLIIREPGNRGFDIQYSTAFAPYLADEAAGDAAAARAAGEDDT